MREQRSKLKRTLLDQTQDRPDISLDGETALAVGVFVNGKTPLVGTLDRHAIAPQVEMRLCTAASLLRETSLPLIEVALASGFQDVSHFHRFFRRRFGYTPAQYRRQPPA